MKKGYIILASICLLFSCKNKEAEKLQSQLGLKDDQIELLEGQLDHLKATNGSLLDRMSDLSIVSKAGAESIQQSLENINRQNSYIQDLTKKVQSKDSVNLALVMNLKRSLIDVNDEDIQVEVRGGLVHISIADKLLFQSGISKINNKAKKILGKIAAVINDHNDIQVMVEGHTDNVPINNEYFKDNWDLSVNRAMAVVKSLQMDYSVNPTRLTAAGRGEFNPKADNNSVKGRSQNRRTEIIIQPRLDQFFNLMESPEVEG